MKSLVAAYLPTAGQRGKKNNNWTLSFKQIARAYNEVGISAGDSSTDRLEGPLEVSLCGT